MRKVIDSSVRNAEERLSRQQLLEMLGLESIEEMIRKKKLQWVAHCARRGEEDLTWRRMKRELEDDGSGWGRQVREDWKRLGVRSVEEWHSKVQGYLYGRAKGGKRRRRGSCKAATRNINAGLKEDDSTAWFAVCS